MTARVVRDHKMSRAYQKAHQSVRKVKPLYSANHEPSTIRRNTKGRDEALAATLDRKSCRRPWKSKGEHKRYSVLSRPHDTKNPIQRQPSDDTALFKNGEQQKQKPPRINLTQSTKEPSGIVQYHNGKGDFIVHLFPSQHKHHHQRLY